VSKFDIEKNYDLKSGDEVEVVTKNGNKYKIVLTEVSEDSLKGNTNNVAINDS